jgi:ZIP family zinc transporter
VGALIGYLVLMPFLTPAVLAGTLAFVAGIMIYISLESCCPWPTATATPPGHQHVAFGMLVMAQPADA